MKAKWKNIWVKALRSGKYKQTKSVLYNGTGYCCLGVLCKVTGQKFQKNPQHQGQSLATHITIGSQAFYLPQVVMKITGVQDKQGAFGLTFDKTLTHHNDCGASFADIADLIEEHWKKM